MLFLDFGLGTALWCSNEHPERKAKLRRVVDAWTKGSRSLLNRHSNVNNIKSYEKYAHHWNTYYT